MAEEKTLSSKQIYEGRSVSLRVDKIELPSGRETTREVVEHRDCVAIVPVGADDNVLLVSQFRHPVEKKLLEIPAEVSIPEKTLPTRYAARCRRRLATCLKK